MRGNRLVLSSLALLVACGQENGAEDAGDNTGGMGIPQQRGSEVYPGDRRTVEPRVHLASNGCFLGSLPDTGKTSRYLIVWPADTVQGSAGDELRLPDGTAVHDGDVLAGDGMLMPTRKLEGFGADGYWDLAVGFCTPQASEVLVLDSVATR
jgi:hypothetical protein